ncbi:unnamed protein product [Caenorhabditis angaria]|uniref:F-box domain-containing protein n=1 Tax=Caenorhabditis angaria TaxID=860376 RepID=A0A9P1I8J4_9PELO|nr:unnamed protein product [Caenorhabditis angaria]
MVLLKFKNESDYESLHEKVGKIFFFDWKEIENPFDILPMEMKMMIFIYLDPEDITQFGKCSKSCQKLFKLFRPKIKSVYYQGNIMSALEHSQECFLQIQFHKYPGKIYEIVIETLKSINSKKISRRNKMIDSELIIVETIGSKQLSTKDTKGSRSSIFLTKFSTTPQSTYQDVKLLLQRTNPKCRQMIALEMFKNIIEFNKSSIDEITIEANIIESFYMRSIDIYSENLKLLRIDGNFTNHPQLNQFLSIEFVRMKNFKISSQHLPMIKSKYLELHRTVMDQRLYELFLKNWRDGLMENLRGVSMVGDEHDWFRCLFGDNTMLRFVMGENGQILENGNHAIRCEVVGSPSVDINIQGVLIDHIHRWPVRMNLRREDF